MSRFISGCIVLRVSPFSWNIRTCHHDGTDSTCLFRFQLITYRVASRPYTHVHVVPGLSLCIGPPYTTVPDLHNTWLFTDSRTPPLSSSSKNCGGHVKRIT